MKTGTVLFWKGFTFEDGGQANKLLLVVGGNHSGNRLLLKTTSQSSHFRPDPDGCHAGQSVHRFKQYLGGFKIPTWVQFDPPIIKHIDEIKLKSHHQFTMSQRDLQAVVHCYRASPDISDILNEYLIWRG